MNVVVRTHGGLGNQLFQLLYARLFASVHGAQLFEVHDLRYAHAFERSRGLVSAPRPPRLLSAISALRIPKVATRCGFRRDAVSLCGTTFLDGYFQNINDYRAFDDELLRTELLHMRRELKVSSAPPDGIAVHLRLGDFFSSEAEVTAHLRERLQRIAPGASIVTNEEDRLATPSAVESITRVGAHVVPTGDMSPEEVLRTLAGFSYVDGNDSTLLFWASVLSGMECEYRHLGLRTLRSHFLNVLAS